MRIAEALMALREAAGLSQEKAAKMAGDHPGASTLALWETGELVPNLLELNAFLEAMGYNFHDLQNALEGLDLGPERAPVDWLDEFLQLDSGESVDREAVAKTLARLEAMYEGMEQVPQEISNLRDQLRSMLEG